MRRLFTATIFLNAALLFLVQPLVAKMALPLFGGSPAVWIVSMLFFQAALLGGYAYAHGQARRLSGRTSAWVHVALLGVAALTLPLALPTGFEPPASEDPTGALLALLARVVGPTFLMLAAGAPLLQRWYATTGADGADDPYFLYSASNLGSMLALLAYPFLLEPSLNLASQSRLWSGGYALLVVAMATCAFAARPREPLGEPTRLERSTVGARERLLWLGLAAVPSSLLLGVTTYLTSNLTPIPLLWVVPLALYLATFIAAFARRPIIQAAQLGRLLPLLATPLALVLVLEASEPLLALALIHLGVFVTAAWMCHARLAESRPHTSHLTEFYLWIALGGVVGGLFNAAVAPLIFRTVFEYPLALAAAAMLIPGRPGRRSWRDLAWPAGIFALVGAATWVAAAIAVPPSGMRTLAVIGIPAIVCFLAVDRPLRFGLCLLALFAATQTFDTVAGGDVLAKRRSFFGVHRVLLASNELGDFHQLVHGNTTHGKQSLSNPAIPLTYYYPTGPAGQVFRYFTGERAKARVGLVGLGVGALAAYGEPGQRYDYFEIDPAVEAIARNPAWFTYLRDSKAEVRVVLGDARLTLRRAPDGTYGLLVLDAFSSDAIPMHLVTVEAVRMYGMKLSPDGLLLFHVSNRFLDLRPVLGGIAARLGWDAYEQDDTGLTDQEVLLGKEPSKWVLLSPRPLADAERFALGAWSPLPGHPEKAWTDDFSNLLSAWGQGGDEAP